ncbi:MAG: hypothetical protein DDT19_02968 [Syntrophomonadaceae bacterium]|nr:hypothetical protein [Bacillota bacterium]
MTAGAAEGVNVSSISVRSSDDAGTGSAANALGAAFTNLRLMSGAVQLGTTVVTSTADAAATLYTFHLSPVLSIPAGTSVQIDLFADVLGVGIATWRAVPSPDRTQLDSATGTGKITGSAANIPSALLLAKRGQAITLTDAGTLGLNIDPTSPATMQMVMGAADQTLGVWRFSATTEDITVTQLTVNNLRGAISSGNVRNLKLFVGGRQVGSTVPALVGNNTTFTLPTGLFTIPRGETRVVVLRADITSFADGATTNEFVRMSITPPTTITGVATDTIIARGASGNFALVATADQGVAHTVSDQYQYRTTLTPAITAVSPMTRGTTVRVATLSLTGGTTTAQIRPALQANDEADGPVPPAVAGPGNDWIAVDADGAVTVNTTAGQRVDGSASIQIVSAANTASSLVFDFGTADTTPRQPNPLHTFSRVSFWIHPTISTGATTFNFVACSDVLLATCQQRTAFTPTMGVLNYITMPLSVGDLVPGTRYAGVTVAAGVTGAIATTSLDNLRFWNDSIVIDIAGNIHTGALGTSIALRDAGGVIRAIGYVPVGGASAVTLIGGNDIDNAPSSVPVAGLIEVGTTPLVLDVITNTHTLIAVPASGIAQNLHLSLDLGTPTAVGDFRWWDQAIAATTSIIWINPAPTGLPTPISGTASTVTGG